MDSKQLEQKALAALTQAVGKVIERHKKTGRPLVVWENGMVVHKDPSLVKSIPLIPKS